MSEFSKQWKIRMELRRELARLQKSGRRLDRFFSKGLAPGEDPEAADDSQAADEGDGDWGDFVDEMEALIDKLEVVRSGLGDKTGDVDGDRLHVVLESIISAMRDHHGDLSSIIDALPPMKAAGKKSHTCGCVGKCRCNRKRILRRAPALVTKNLVCFRMTPKEAARRARRSQECFEEHCRRFPALSRAGAR